MSEAETNASTQSAATAPLARPARRSSWVFPQAIPAAICDLIEASVATEIELHPSGTTQSEATIRSEHRKSSHGFLESTHWIAALPSHYIHLANGLNFHFDLTRMESVQLTPYEVGDYYKWHADGAPNWKPTVRKLSCTIQVTDPELYDGGVLEFMGTTQRVEAMPRQRGDVIVFDSRVSHQVTPVTRGRRTSIVAWYQGPQFR